MYQDLSFMKIPLPEDVLKLKNYGDYAGAQKVIRYFLEHKEIPKAQMSILTLMPKHWR